MRSKSLPMLVQDAILHLIQSGDLGAGAKLNEVALATRLGVSRGPVREAFRALEEAGLVRLEKNRGVFVREIRPDEAVELYELRAGLDEIAGRILAPRVTDAELGELSELVEQMDQAGSIERYFPLNIRFHDRIVEMAGNRPLMATYRRVINEMHLLRRHGLVSGGGLRVSNDEHRAIVEALAARRPDSVVETMRGHVTAGRERLMLAIRLGAASAAD
ncbi:MAG: FCD domain-containing protein [Alphaproteobacteria bacterium]|nr:FCD domain-containing protein [Alphaproteobacteria bacterium]